MSSTTKEQNGPSSVDSFPALQRALHHATEHLSGVHERSVAAVLSCEDLRRRLGGALPETGLPPTRVVDELVAATAGGHLGCAGGSFYAWVVGGALESALAADWLTATWDQPSALYATGPAAAIAEEIAGQWLKELLDLPREASFAFTTGCQVAHFVCLAAARYAVLRDVGWDVNENGLFGAPPIRIVTSEERHASIDRAIRYIGLGNRSLVLVSTGADGRIDVASFERALAASQGPTIVVLDAADLNIAAFDPFAELIPMAKKVGAWVHVDGAFGLIARASRSKRCLTAGVELADSWALDGHKWLNVPYDNGVAIVRDREAHRASMTVSASYIAAEKQARDQIDWNPEWSRRARGFTVWAALKELGRQGVEQMVDRCCEHARAIVEGVGALAGAEALWVPHLNQGLFRFLDPRPNASEVDHDARTDAIVAAVNKGGGAFFSNTTWRGKRAVRVSVVNWRTSQRDVERTVASVAAALRQNLP